MIAPSGTLRVAAAQTPEFREDLPAASAYLCAVAEEAQAQGVSLLCYPEGFLQGYITLEATARRHALDLRSPQFSEVLKSLSPVAPIIVVGLVEQEDGFLYNTAVIISHQRMVGRYRKRHLLQSESCFQAGEESPTFLVEGVRFGVAICNDLNFSDVAVEAAAQGASLMLCPSNNMLPATVAENWKAKHNVVRGERCREAGVWLMSADVTGERDGWVALGPTAVLSRSGEIKAQLPLGAPGLLVFDLPHGQAA